jgi:hypothetical protein
VDLVAWISTSSTRLTLDEKMGLQALSAEAIPKIPVSPLSARRILENTIQGAGVG